MASGSFDVAVSAHAVTMFAAIAAGAQRKITAKIESLRDDPNGKGKPLTGDLAGIRSMPAAGRYRVLYRVRESHNQVRVVAVGIRKEGDKQDVYEIASRMLARGEFE